MFSTLFWALCLYFQSRQDNATKQESNYILLVGGIKMEQERCFSSLEIQSFMLKLCHPILQMPTISRTLNSLLNMKQ